MATPYDALAFREIFGRTLRHPERGVNLAYWVTPLGKLEEREAMQDREVVARINAVRHQLIDIVEQGDIFYVNSEITAMLLEQAQQLSDDRVLHFEPGDFPTRAGFVYFDGLLPTPTVLSRDGVQPLRAMLWGQLLRGPGGPDGAVSWLVPGSDTGTNAEVVGKVIYTVVDNPERWRNRTIERVMVEKMRVGRWVTRHWLPLEYGVRWSGSLARDMMESSHADYLTEAEQVEDNDGSQASAALTLKLLYIWSQFIQTEIVGHSQFDSHDHDKVMAREGRPPARIRIVTLRRYASVPTNNVVDVNWQYRWKVREHYRNQRVGPGRAFIRRTLIREHWKGPEDKPQVHQDTIQAIVR